MLYVGVLSLENKIFSHISKPWLKTGLSFSYNGLGVTQSLHGNVYKVVNYEGQVTMCNYNFRTSQSNQTLRA